MSSHILLGVHPSNEPAEACSPGYANRLFEWECHFHVFTPTEGSRDMLCSNQNNKALNVTITKDFTWHCLTGALSKIWDTNWKRIPGHVFLGDNCTDVTGMVMRIEKYEGTQFDLKVGRQPSPSLHRDALLWKTPSDWPEQASFHQQSAGHPKGSTDNCLSIRILKQKSSIDFKTHSKLSASQYNCVHTHA